MLLLYLKHILMICRSTSLQLTQPLSDCCTLFIMYYLFSGNCKGVTWQPLCVVLFYALCIYSFCLFNIYNIMEGFFIMLQLLCLRTLKDRASIQRNSCVQEAITLLYWDCSSTVSYRAVHTSAALPRKYLLFKMQQEKTTSKHISFLYSATRLALIQFTYKLNWLFSSNLFLIIFVCLTDNKSLPAW